MNETLHKLKESLTGCIENYVALQNKYIKESPGSVDELNKIKNDFESLRNQIINIWQSLYSFLAEQNLTQTNKEYVYTQIEKSHIHIEILTYSLINPIIQQINDLRINTAIEKIEFAIKQEKILIKSSRISIITAWIIFLLSIIASFFISYYLSNSKTCSYQVIPFEEIPESEMIDTNAQIKNFEQPENLIQEREVFIIK